MTTPKASKELMNLAEQICELAKQAGEKKVLHFYRKDVMVTLVEGAGGGVYSLDGKPLAYGKDALRNPAIITVGDLSYNWSGLIS